MYIIGIISMASKMVRRTTVRYVANDTCDTLERGGGKQHSYARALPLESDSFDATGPKNTPDTRASEETRTLT